MEIITDKSSEISTKIENYVEISNKNIFEYIYYGSPSLKCYLTNVDGDFVEFDKEIFYDYYDKSTVSSSLSYLYSQKHLGKDYENLYLPAVPSNEIMILPVEYIKNNQNPKLVDVKFDSLIKIPENLVLSFYKQDDKEKRKFYIGWKSGIRSAIIPLNNKFYRLKGCGNNDEGFIIQKLGFRKEGEEIRGCQFKHTSVREVYMSDKINRILENYGFEVANKPKGIIFYDDLNKSFSELKDSKNRIMKTCSVYEVLAEKRVGCHLMPGIEMLFVHFVIAYLKKYKFHDYLCKSFSQKFNFNSGLVNMIKGMYVEERWTRKPLPKTEEEIRKQKEIEEENKREDERRRKEKEEKGELEEQFKADRENINLINLEKQAVPKVSFSQQICDFSPTFQHINVINLTVDQNLDSLFSHYKIYEYKIDRSHFSDFTELEHKANERESSDIFKNSNSIFFSSADVPKLRYENLDFARFLFNDNNLKDQKDYINKLMKCRVEYDITEKLDSLFDSEKSLIFLSSLLYSRIGFEIGKIKRILQDNDINWGTFEDLPFRFHCNAHTDNLVIIPHKIRIERITNTNKTPNLIAILDFDLAFSREKFISLSLDITEKYGENDKFLFDSYLNGERQHLEWELAGIENVNIFSFLSSMDEKTFSKEDKNIIDSNNFNLCFQTLVYLLRDNAVLGYQDGYLLKEFKHQQLFEKYYDQISHLIEVGLLSSHDFLG